jgi:hypothetical protein
MMKYTVTISAGETISGTYNLITLEIESEYELPRTMLRQKAMNACDTKYITFGNMRIIKQEEI